MIGDLFERKKNHFLGRTQTRRSSDCLTHGACTEATHQERQKQHGESMFLEIGQTPKEADGQKSEPEQTNQDSPEVEPEGHSGDDGEEGEWETVLSTRQKRWNSYSSSERAVSNWRGAVDLKQWCTQRQMERLQKGPKGSLENHGNGEAVAGWEKGARGNGNWKEVEGRGVGNLVVIEETTGGARINAI